MFIELLALYKKFMTRAHVLPVQAFKNVLVSFVIISLLMAYVVVPQPSRASGLTSTQIQSILSLLQSFGADQATIDKVATDLGASSTPTPGPTINYSGGSLSFSTDPSTPSYGVVAAGNTGVTLGVYKFYASGEPVILQRVGLKLTSGSPRDLLQVYLYNGSQLVGTATFTGNNTFATSSLQTSVTIPQDSSMTLTVKADLSGIGVSQQGISGDVIKVDASSAQGVGSQSGATINGTGNTNVMGVRMYHTFPVFTYGFSSSNMLANGMTHLFTLNVTANSSGEISLNKLTFSIAATGATVSGLTFVGPNGSVGTVTQTNTGAVVAFNSSVNVADSMVAAGQSKTYTLGGTVTGATSGSAVVIALKGDASPAPISPVSSLTSSNIIWSPDSTTTSTVASTDWTNSYGLGGCYASSGLGQDCAVQTLVGSGSTPVPTSGSSTPVVTPTPTPVTTVSWDFGGMYGYGVNTTYKNPGTGAVSCPTGYSADKALGATNVDYPVVACYRAHTSSANSLYDFGGMYSTGIANGNSFSNPITGTFSCPSGYTSDHVLGGPTGLFGLSIIDNSLYFCYRPHTSTKVSYAFGGIYGYGASSSHYNNPITGAMSCPTGYTAAQVLGTANIDWPMYFCYQKVTVADDGSDAYYASDTSVGKTIARIINTISHTISVLNGGMAAVYEGYVGLFNPDHADASNTAQHFMPPMHLRPYSSSTQEHFSSTTMPGDQTTEKNAMYEAIQNNFRGNSACAFLVRTLSKGNTGDDVSKLQDFLRGTGDLSASSTGFFGAATQAALQKFQLRAGVSTGGDASSTGFGIVGPKTRMFIMNACMNHLDLKDHHATSTGTSSTPRMGDDRGHGQYSVGSTTPTCTLTADKASVQAGDNVTLTWTSQNAEYASSINGARGPVQGSITMSPMQTTTYLKKVYGFGGVGECTVTVEVASSTPAATPKVVTAPSAGDNVAAAITAVSGGVAYLVDAYIGLFNWNQ